VLPPKNPKYNAHVERAHRTLREEFYGQYRHELTMRATKPRPGRLPTPRPPPSGKRQNFRTPMAYYQRLKEAA